MSAACTLSSDLNCDSPQHSVDRRSKPWTRLLELDLLSSPSVDKHSSEIFPSEECQPHHHLIEPQPTQHAQKSRPGSSDYDGHFRQGANDFDEDAGLEELEYDLQLPELTQQRAQKVDDFTTNCHEGAFTFMRRKTCTSTSQRDKTGTVHRSKSFVQNISRGIRSFLPRTFRPRVNRDDIPVRLNRLHGADESSMSVLAPTIRREFRKMSNLSNRPRRASWKRDIHEDDDDERYENELSYGPMRHCSRPDSSRRRCLSGNESLLFAHQIGGVANSLICRQGGECTCGCFENESDDRRERRLVGKLGTADVKEDNKKPFRSYNPLVGPAPFDPNISDSDSDTLSWNTRQGSKKGESPIRVPDLIQYYNAGDSVKDREPNRRSCAAFKMQPSFDVKSIRALFERNEENNIGVRFGKKWAEQRAVAPIRQTSSLHDYIGTSKGRAGKSSVNECGNPMKVEKVRRVSSTSYGDYFGETSAFMKAMTAEDSEATLYTPTQVRKDNGLHRNLECRRLFPSPITPGASPSRISTSDAEMSRPQTGYDAATLGEEDAIVSSEGGMSGIQWLRGSAEWETDVSEIGHGRGHTGRLSMEDKFDPMGLLPRSNRENNKAWHARSRFQPIDVGHRRKEVKVEMEKGRKSRGGNDMMVVRRTKSLLIGIERCQKRFEGRRKSVAGMKRDEKKFARKVQGQGERTKRNF